MEKKTLAFCLNLLDVQRAHMDEGDPISAKVQAAYYDGMRRMLEAAVSEAYTEDYFVTCKSGKHSILA